MSKVQDYAAFTPVSADKFLGTDDPAGTPLTRNSTVLLLLGATEFGEIYLTGGAGTQVPGAVYALCTAPATNGYASAGVTADAANDKITVTETGFYKVDITLTFSNNTAEQTDFRVYYNGAAQTRLTASVTTVVNARTQIVITGYIDVTTGAQDIDLRCQCAAGTLTYREMNFAVTRVGNT